VLDWKGRSLTAQERVPPVGGLFQTPHPTPYTLHSTHYTLHPTPYTLHPTPYTLHPTPYRGTRLSEVSDQPSEWDQTTFSSPLDLYWRLPDSGGLWYESRLVEKDDLPPPGTGVLDWRGMASRPNSATRLPEVHFKPYALHSTPHTLHSTP